MEHSCILCKLPLKVGELYFCSSCLSLFESKRLCPRCGLPTSEEDMMCEKCRHNPPIWNQLDCICGYQFPMDLLIQRFKYQEQTWLLNPLIELLAPKVQVKPEVLIPVPMHWKRQFKRGYNQSNLLTTALSERIHIPVDYSLVTRNKVTHPQQGLNAKQREKNLKDAFTLNTPIAYKHVALVDDVVTTGTTANKIVRLLLDNGVQTVDVICLSRTKY